MLVAFQIILLIIMTVTLFGTVGEVKNQRVNDNMTYICITSILSYVAVVILS